MIGDHTIGNLIEDKGLGLSMERIAIELALNSKHIKPNKMSVKLINVKNTCNINCF